jgi:hypothetical protein
MWTMVFIVASSAANNLIVNNIVAFNVQYGVRTSGLSGTGNQVNNNIVFGQTDNLGTTSGLSLSGNQITDPKLVSASDPHLQSTSPAIGAALDAYAPIDDYDGVLRSDPDIGAFEAR